MDSIGAAGSLASVGCAASQHVTVPAAKTELVRGNGEDARVKIGTGRLNQMSVSAANAESENELPNINSLSSSDENIPKAGSSEKHIKPNDSTSEATAPEVGSIAARNISPAEPEHASGNWILGGLYASFDDGAYKCFKVLAVDDEVLHIKPFFTRYEQLPSVQECKKEDDLSKRVFQDLFRVDESSGDDSPDCQCSDGPLGASVGHTPSVQESREQDDLPKRVAQDSPRVDESSEGSLSDDDCPDCQCSDGPLGTFVGHMPSVQESKEQDDLPKRVVQDSPRVDESSEGSLSDDDCPDCQCSGGLFGNFVGHMPVARSHFEGMNAQLIVTTSIVDCELVGYRDWQDSDGGYFF